MANLSTASFGALRSGLGSLPAAKEIRTILNTVDVLDDTEAGFLDGVTAGTSAASKALVLDSNSELDGLGQIEVTDTLIATGEVLALNATPITVVPAPASGSYNEFLGAYVFLDYNSAAYVAGAGEDLVFAYTDENGDVVSQSSDGTMWTGTADTLVKFNPTSANASTTGTMVVDAVIVLKLLSGEWITGDSPLKVRVFSRQVRGASLAAIA